MSRSRRSSTQKELEEHTDGEPPRMIYHGTKQFWRQRTQLDLHIYQCAKQFTVVPFHKERHEEFESLYLDRAKIEEIMLSEKTDDLLDQFGGASSTDDKKESSSSSMDAFHAALSLLAQAWP